MVDNIYKLFPKSRIMKKTIMLLMLAAALILSSCTGGAGKGGAKDIATQFATAYVIEADPTAMLEFCDDKAAKKVEEDFFNIKESHPEVYEAIIKAMKEMKFSAEINDSETKISGTESEIVFDLHSQLLDKPKERLKVDVKKNAAGIWQVYNWKLGGTAE